MHVASFVSALLLVLQAHLMIYGLELSYGGKLPAFCVGLKSLVA